MEMMVVVVRSRNAYCLRIGSLLVVSHQGAVFATFLIMCKWNPATDLSIGSNVVWEKFFEKYQCC